jgi:hypothetical protein
MTSISRDDALLMGKFAEAEAMRLEPDDHAAVPFCFRLEETESMARLWERGLIEPTGAATAQLTSAGVLEARRLWR